MTRERLIPAAVVATVLGIGLIVLQRWVAETKFAAIVLIGVWFVVVGIGAFLFVSRRPELRLPVLGTFAAIVVGSVAIGYWTGFRDTEVDEDVVVATAEASPAERDSALAGASPEASGQGADAKPEARPERKDDGSKGGSGQDEEPAGGAEPAAEPNPPEAAREPEPEPEPEPKPKEPVALASGKFSGEDGHDGRGIATVVREANGARTLTFTEFDVDPGAKVVVWLTQDETSFDDRVDLGTLKGNVGDQQYDIPDDADLRKYDTVVLYCTPFTVRIAVAPLG